MSRRTAAWTLLLAAACGPRGPAHEPKPAPDDSLPDVESNVQFLESMALPPEIAAAIAAQRQKVVPMPPPLGETAFDFPDVRVGKLAGGMRWYLVEDHRLPIVSLNLVVRAGFAHDPAALQGLAAFTAEMLREGGTGKRSTADLAQGIEELGADLSIVTGVDYTMVAVDSLSGTAPELLALMSEMTLDPAFGSDEMERLRERERHRLELSRSDPEWIADFVFLEKLYGSHPYSRYDTKTEALDAMKREDVVSFHSKHYTASNSFFIAVGDVTAEALGSALGKSFGPMPKGSPVKIAYPAIPKKKEREVVIVDRPGSAQTVIRVGNTTIEGKHPDALPLMVTNHVLGGNASSRLFLDLREEKSLTYGAYSHVPMRVDVGCFFVETSTKTESTAEALSAIFSELDSFVAKGAVSEEELGDTKRFLAGVLAIDAQTPSSIADLLIETIVYGLPADFYDTYTKNVEAVTPPVVHDMASRHIHPDSALVVLVGDASAVKDSVAPWGHVSVVEWKAAQPP